MGMLPHLPWMPEVKSPRPAVVVDGLAKTFTLPTEQVHTLKERALHPFRRSSMERLEALRGVSFVVEPGEFFGIVGRNGSGKSTLLKCLAGIYRADQGSIHVNGRLSTFIELGVGFNPDLAARDNVTINGVMMGLTPREARDRFDAVIEFSELEEFVDMKLKNYSSGMQVRLAFSVAIQVDADVLLIDEVLAVGDAAFAQKCFDVFYRMRDAGRTVLLVTHDMGAVKRFCNRALLLERGEVVDFGDPDHVARSYLELNFGYGHAPDAGPQDDEDTRERSGDQAAQLVDAWFEDEDGQRVETLVQTRAVRFRARAEFARAVDHPVMSVLFEDADRHALFATSTEWKELETGSFAPGETATFEAAFDVPFAPGRVYATPVITHRGAGMKVIDRRDRLVSVVVTGTHHSGGLVMVPHDVSFQRSGREVSA